MSKRRPYGIRRPQRDTSTRKAIAGGSVLPGGLALPAGGIATDATGLIQSIQAQTAQPQAVDTTNKPLPRDQFWALFGPGAPLYPAPLNPSNPRTGQPDPRRWEYAVSWNLQQQGGKLVDWSTLRTAAESVDVIRRCIEIRKTEMVQLEWDITPSKRAMQRAGANTPAEKAAMRDKYTQDIERAVAFWTTPDRNNGLSFSDWLVMLLEEYFVLDALSIYPRMTFGGELHSLNIIDGATIKPLLDEYGNTPTPPDPAYQQYLWGFPRGEYTAGDNPEFEADAGSMLYRPRHRRTWTPYGYSPVEQALVSADIYLRRQGWMKAEYQEGTLPAAWLKSDAEIASMTPEQLRAWETSLNDFYSGSTTNRHRLRLLPNGFDPVTNPDAAERYKPDYDEFLVKMLTAHFDVDPSEFGITPKAGLGGAGYEAGRENAQYRTAIRPMCEWLTDIFDHINHRFLGLPQELTFSWLGMESEDEVAADEVSAARVSSGRMTINEDRDRIGLPRYTGEWADQPMIQGASGPVWLEQAWDDATAPPEPVPAPLAGNAGLPPGGPPNEEDVEEAVKAELSAFGRYLRKRGRASRPFEFKALAKADAVQAEQLNLLAATDPDAARQHASRLLKAGGAGGRGEAPAGRSDAAGSRPHRQRPPGGYQAGFEWGAP